MPRIITHGWSGHARFNIPDVPGLRDRSAVVFGDLDELDSAVVKHLCNPHGTQAWIWAMLAAFASFDYYHDERHVFTVKSPNNKGRNTVDLVACIGTNVEGRMVHDWRIGVSCKGWRSRVISCLTLHIAFSRGQPLNRWQLRSSISNVKQSLANPTCKHVNMVKFLFNDRP